MSVWDICIRRPVFTVMIVAAPVVLGLAALGRLGIDLMPSVDFATVTVSTSYPGASAEEVEASVTKPIEEAVNTLGGIDELRSTSKEGMSAVTVQFELSKNGAVAAYEVESKIRATISQLPTGAQTPVVSKVDPDSSPVVTVAVYGNRDPREVTELARKKLKEELETLDGVGSVTLIGGRRRAVQVVIDPDRLAGYENLTVEDVRQAVLRGNKELPGGRIDRGRSELTLRTIGRVGKPAEFEGLIITDRGGQPVRIRDVGRVEDSYEEPRTLSRLWSRDRHAADGGGEAAVCLYVQKQSGTNTVAVVDAVKRRLADLEPQLPDDIRVEVIRDQSRFIKSSIGEVKTHLVLAAVLVSLTILLFIRDWRTTLIATVAIPTSMVGTFAFMSWMGFTLNNMTMLGLILAVGIVVDDAVVVHENIFRHMEEYGRSARAAASAATKEISLAVVATTLSLLVIFAPIVFMGGRPGRFFGSFGYVVAFSVLLSLCVSLTMTPMLCSRFLKRPEGARSKDGAGWRLVAGAYTAVLGWSLRHRWAVVLISVGVLASTPVTMSRLGFDFMPQDDQSEFEVSITLPEGYSLDRADEAFGEVDRRLRELRGVELTYTVIGDTTGNNSRGEGEVTKGTLYVRITDLKRRDYSQFDVMNDARAVLVEYPDLKASVQESAAISAAGLRQVMIDVNLRGPDMNKLQQYSDEIADWMRAHGGYIDVDTSLGARKPELRMRPDRERMSDLGVSPATVGSTANVLVGGELLSSYKELDETYDVWLRAELGGRRNEDGIGRLTVPSTKAPSGVTQLGNVVRFEAARGPATIERMSRQRQVVVSANLADGFSLGTGVSELTEHLRSKGMPAEYSFEFTGRAKVMKETDNQFGSAFLLAFVFMYMVLAAQFESLVHPISILAALPLVIPCALVSLVLLGSNLELYSIIGLLMLVGIVKKNGILQIDYTNQLRAGGRPRDAAILEANRTRLRPILMTTVMLVAAMVPMALGEGPGAAARAGMAKLIIGGQSLSLLLTLLVTPVAYSLFDDFGRWLGRVFRSEPKDATERAPEAPPSSGTAVAGEVG
ncbi:efflux RND transporter permease subunit [Frigoriglobus tundricola]|uniref:RND efflux system, inner membrane transporter n=1 Tax=Frigoriglobus tundricola TaxID=2774151 RepID=A0A6M5YMH6_9BACT|nr:efflux RND transporter permease subunit [Frigoriglobus tundricola]QJW94794.1 RND efflux system, inner membrane transporter [Frigoriglobus tundricola]